MRQKNNSKFYYRVNKKNAILLAGFLLFAVIGVVAAETTGPVQPICDPAIGEMIGDKCVVKNPANNYLVDIRDFGSLLTRAISWALYFAGGIAVLFLLVGGFQYIASRGNEEQMEKAKKTITGAVIGIVIITMAYAIVVIVTDLVVRSP